MSLSATCTRQDSRSWFIENFSIIKFYGIHQHNCVVIVRGHDNPQDQLYFSLLLMIWYSIIELMITFICCREKDGSHK